jgi:hypothetical protein
LGREIFGKSVLSWNAITVGAGALKFGMRRIEFASKTLEFEVDGVPVKLDTDDKKITFLAETMGTVSDGCLAIFSDGTQFEYRGFDEQWIKHLVFGENNISIPHDVVHVADKLYSCRLDIATVSFAGCRALATIGEHAFADCHNLRSVDFADSAPTLIGMYAFSGCINLQDLKIPPSVLEIGAYAFGECHSLVNVEIPPSVSKIQGEFLATL